MRLLLCDRLADQLPIARELGIGESNLGYWLKKDQADPKASNPERFANESPSRPRTGHFGVGWPNWRWSARS